MTPYKHIRLVLTLLLSALSSCISDEEPEEWALCQGDPLPRFEVVTLDGETISSADSYSAELVIVFFTTTCPDCRRELPLLQQQYEANLNLPEQEQSKYICISREEAASDVRKYWAENQFTLPVSPQTDRKIYSLFASVGIPRVFYAKDGVITKSVAP